MRELLRLEHLRVRERSECSRPNRAGAPHKRSSCPSGGAKHGREGGSTRSEVPPAIGEGECQGERGSLVAAGRTEVRWRRVCEGCREPLRGGDRGALAGATALAQVALPSPASAGLSCFYGVEPAGVRRLWPACAARRRKRRGTVTSPGRQQPGDVWQPSLGQDRRQWTPLCAAARPRGWPLPVFRKSAQPCEDVSLAGGAFGRGYPVSASCSAGYSG